jgi:hypothetical protein
VAGSQWRRLHQPFPPRRLLGRCSRAPPLRVPLRALHRHSVLRHRVPCRPDACFPLKPPPIMGSGTEICARQACFCCGALCRLWPKATDFAPQRNVRFQGCSDRRGDHARNVETALSGLGAGRPRCSPRRTKKRWPRLLGTAGVKCQHVN